MQTLIAQGYRKLSLGTCYPVTVYVKTLEPFSSLTCATSQVQALPF